MNEDYFDELHRIVARLSGPRYSPYDMEYGVLQGTPATGNYWQSGWNASAHLTASPTARYYRKVKAEYITPFGINRVYYGGFIPEIVRLVRYREGEEELSLYASNPSFKAIVPYFEQEDIMERETHYIR